MGWGLDRGVTEMSRTRSRHGPGAARFGDSSTTILRLTMRELKRQAVLRPSKKRSGGASGPSPRPRRRLDQIYPTLVVLASNPSVGISGVSVNSAGRVCGGLRTDSERNQPIVTARQERPSQSPQRLIQAAAIVERDGHRQDALGFLGQVGPGSRRCRRPVPRARY